MSNPTWLRAGTCEALPVIPPQHSPLQRNLGHALAEVERQEEAQQDKPRDGQGPRGRVGLREEEAARLGIPLHVAAEELCDETPRAVAERVG